MKVDFMIRTFRWFVLCVLFFVILPSSAFAQRFDDHNVTIGVLAFRPKDVTQREWEPLARYLETKIPSVHFIIQPLSYKELNNAVAQQKVHFVFTNPEHYITLSTQHKVTRIATLIRDENGNTLVSKFGGVIFTRKFDATIRQLSDVANVTIAAVNEHSLGGYLAQRYALYQDHIDISKSKVLFTDMPHDKVVYAVRDGIADVGFVRTGVLEAMIKEGKISRSDFTVLTTSTKEDFYHSLSTQLYAEWPFASTMLVDPKLANQVVIALLSLPYGSSIAKAAGYTGWSSPLAYEDVRHIMQLFYIAPFDKRPTFTLQDLIKSYGIMIIVVLGLLLTVVSWLVYKLRKKTSLLHIKTQNLQESLYRESTSKKALQLAASVFHHAREGIVIANTDFIIIDSNEAYTALVGYTKLELLNTMSLCDKRLIGNGSEQEILEHVAMYGFWEGEITNITKFGRSYSEILRISSVREEHGNVIRYIALHTDITSLKEQQDRLAHMAHYDALTNLPNRRLFSEIAEQALAYDQRKGDKGAVAFIDLDGFKELNDTYGHEFGDEILKYTASILTKTIRSTDTVARLGGDEFIMILHSLPAQEEIILFLNRLLQAIKTPLHLQGHTVTLSASIGVAFFPDDSWDLENLIRFADHAMYVSKDRGKDQVTLYSQITTLK